MINRAGDTIVPASEGDADAAGSHDGFAAVRGRSIEALRGRAAEPQADTVAGRSRSDRGPTLGAAPDTGVGAPPDLERAARAVEELLAAFGIDVAADRTGSLAATPMRVARAYAELLTPEPFEATTFVNDSGYHELVVVCDIPFTTVCEHHLLPFGGVAHVGYVPGERLVGLSKLARAVEHHARRLQVQERLTNQIAEWLRETLHPLGGGVVLDAEHACMSVRGVKARGARTRTSAFVGTLRDDAAQRRELFRRLQGRS